MLIERVEQRILGAMRLVDRVTRTPVTRPLQISSKKASLVRNGRGYYVVTRANGLDHHVASFLKPPATPALESRSFRFEIADPLGHYLPRWLDLRLPRDPDPLHATEAGSLFRPVDVAMYPASTAPLSPNWSTLRISVARASSHAPIRGALLQVIAAADDTLLASGLSDEQGEALVIVPGVPITKFADEDEGPGHGGGGGHEPPPVVVNTLPVRLELSLGNTTSWPVNPDLLEQNHMANRRMWMDLALSTGRMERVIINLT